MSTTEQEAARRDAREVWESQGPDLPDHERRALSALEYAAWALERVGFAITADSRDPWDGITAKAPDGGSVEIRPLDWTDG